MVTTAARPKGLPAADAPTHAPMPPAKSERRNPSTEDRKIRQQQSRQAPRTAQRVYDVEIYATPRGAGTGNANRRSWGTQELCDRHTGMARKDMDEHTMSSPTHVFAASPSNEHEGTCIACTRDAVDAAMTAARKQATIISQDAWLLHPGDYIQGPNNQPVKVNQVRQHKTDADQVYVDTEAGTFAVPRSQSFNLLPGGRSNLQQELPTNLGTPGGNSNTLPGGSVGQGGDAGQSGKSHKCPIDGSPMQLRNTGGTSMWVCPLDGYTQQAASFPGTGGGGGATMDPTMLSNSASKHQSALARRCASVLATQETR